MDPQNPKSTGIRHWPQFTKQYLPLIEDSEEHTVLYELPLDDVQKETPPHPRKGELKWDSFHVRLPCADESKFPVPEEGNDSRVTESRWNVIKEALSKPITNSHDLQRAILVYNSEYKEKWDFKALHKLFEDELENEESQTFFEDLLPRIIKLALQLPDLIQAPIPLLERFANRSISLSQQQVSCLLANSFLCTFPGRNKAETGFPEYMNYHEINFNRFFQSSGPQELEIIKFLLHYFRRVCPYENDISNVPIGVITVTRRKLNQSDLPDWTACSDEIGSTPFNVESGGFLRISHWIGDLQYIGCRLEEIRCMTCPELIVTKLFSELLYGNEALFISGCEDYCDFKGIFVKKWARDRIDCTLRDSSRRRMQHFVLLYNSVFENPDQNYLEDNLLLNLNKAYTRYLHTLNTSPPGITTGNWECEIHRPLVDPFLKVLLHLMVSTVTKRPLNFYFYGESMQRDKARRMYAFLQQKKICDVWNVLRQFHSTKLPSEELYNFITQHI